MAIRGGENVYPREIEEALYGHPAILAAQVVGVHGLGHLARGYAARRRGAARLCRARLAHFKVPRYVKFTSAFPLTVTGKVQKFRLRELAIDELGVHAVRTIPSG
jgi:fatty-acyl-CoA synthase